MTTEIAAIPSSGALTRADWYNPRSVGEAGKLAQMLHESRLAPKAYDSPQKIFAAIVMGAEHGLAPMRSLTTIHVVEGRPSLSADAIVALVKASPVCGYWRVVESSDDRCIVETLRRGSPEPERCEWTAARATSAGLTGKDNWRKYRAQMLRARASAELGRMVYPDVVAGLYTADELDDGAEPTPARVSLIPDANAQPRIGATAHATTQPLADHKQIEAKHGPVSPLILTPDAEPAKVETRAPEAEATKPSTADDLTTKVNRIGKLVHPFMPDEMRPAELRSAIRKFSPDDIADILTQCEAATRDPDEGDTLLRALAGDVLRGPADA